MTVGGCAVRFVRDLQNNCHLFVGPRVHFIRLRTQKAVIACPSKRRTNSASLCNDFANHLPIGTVRSLSQAVSAAKGVRPCVVLHYHDVTAVKWAYNNARDLGGALMPTSTSTQAKGHRLGILLTPSGTRFLRCKDCTLSIDITEGSDATMKAARNKAKRIACTNTPNAFSSDWGSRRALG